jgi:hypothetical protein
MKRNYEIIDERAVGDARGELGGVKIENRGGKRIVSMSAAQAKWFLEHGTIKLATTPPASDTAPKRTRGA